MNIHFVNSHESSGGAAIAAARLLKGLNSIDGIDAKLYCQHLSRSSSHAIGPTNILQSISASLRPYADRFRAINYGVGVLHNYNFSTGWLSTQRKLTDRLSSADIVHLNWINNGFISISALNNIRRPIIWTLHDMWAMTGGCHYSGKCDNYTYQCGRCPELNSTKPRDLSTKIQTGKRTKWLSIPLQIVCPSKWLAQCANNSQVLKDKNITVIPNGIDTSEFKPIKKYFARNYLRLPINKKLVLFNAYNAKNDVRKGLDTCINTMNEISMSGYKNIELMLLGESSIESLHPQFPVHCLGKVNDENTLSMIYSAADIFLNPSKQDNLPNTVLEAMSCGIPCVTSNIGGFPDLVNDNENGYMCKPSDYLNFSKSIIKITSNESLYKSFSVSARKKVLKYFDLNIISNRYKKLYQDALKNNV